MAAIAVARVKNGTLLAAVVDTITFGQSAGEVRITNLSAALAIYITLDGSAPTIAGDDCYAIAPLQTRSFGPADVSRPVVNIISSGAAVYSVEI